MTDQELETQAQEIFEQVRTLPGPRDAASVLMLAFWKLLEEAFAPEQQADAIAVVDANCDLLKSLIKERVQ